MDLENDKKKNDFMKLYCCKIDRINPFFMMLFTVQYCTGSETMSHYYINF